MTALTRQLVELKRTLRVGLVGCGGIAVGAHLPCYAMNPRAKVIAVTDTIEEKARSTARAFNVEKSYKDFGRMLRDEEIDAIDICSPPNVHAEQAIMAAEARKHILCEKPISTNMEDARNLESAVKRAGVKFMTGFTYRFHPLLKKAKEEVGQPNLLRISYSFRPTVTSDHWIHNFGKSGGFVIEQAVHWFDLFRWWSGKPKSVYAQARENVPFQNLIALISFENDSLGLIDYNSNSQLSFFHFTVESPEKSAMIRIGLLPSKWGGSLEINGKDGNQAAYVLRGAHLQACNGGFSPLARLLSKLQDSHLIPFYHEIAHFVDSILGDKQPSVSLYDGLESLKVATAALKSIAEGKELHL